MIIGGGQGGGLLVDLCGNSGSGGGGWGEVFLVRGSDGDGA